jgi:hypothetical protein
MAASTHGGTKIAANFQSQRLKVDQFVSLSSRMESMDTLRFGSRAHQPTDESLDRLTRLEFRFVSLCRE